MGGRQKLQLAAGGKKRRAAALRGGGGVLDEAFCLNL
jgi:hypothetical protein